MSIERERSSEVIIPQKLIVEIGCGNFPFPIQGSRRLSSNEKYIGIDSRHPQTWGDYDPVAAALEKLNKAKPPLEGIYEVIEWDGRMVQLPDRSVDEVHFQNVLGDSNNLMIRQDLLREGARLLKGTGILRVVEDDTPFNTPPSLIREYVAPLGMMQLNEGQEQDPDHLSQYSSIGFSYSSISFIAEFGFKNPISEVPDNLIQFRLKRKI